MSYIHVKAKTPAELSEVCHMFPRDLKIDLWGGKYTPESYLKQWGKTHTVISFDPQSVQFRAMTPKAATRLKLPTLDVATFMVTIRGLYKPYVKQAPQFWVGFEIEGFIDEDAQEGLCEYVNDLYENKAEVHGDDSLKDCPAGFIPIEISTPPLPLADGMTRLEWFLGTLSIMSKERLFVTNATCGFHVNLSEQHLFSSVNHDLRKRFTFNLMQCFDPQKWRRTFKRTRNKYCWWTGRPKTPDDIHRVNETKRMAVKLDRPFERAQHWSAINTQHVDAPEPTARRIEIRVAGGKDYHMQHDCLCDYMLDIEAAIEQAHQQV